MSGLCWMCRINLIFQVLLLVSGRGRYFYETWGGSRFMGTFNDPNQFAVFIFIMMLVLFMEYRRKAVYTAKTRIGFWGMFLLGVFLIGKAKSTGMFIGLLVFVGVLTGQFFWDKCCHSKQKKVWWFGGAAFLVLLTVDVYLILPGADFDVSQTDYTLLSRIQQKIWKLANGNIYDLLYDRSIYSFNRQQVSRILCFLSRLIFNTFTINSSSGSSAFWQNECDSFRTLSASRSSSPL